MKKTIAIIGSGATADHAVIRKLALSGYPLLLTGKEWEGTQRCILNEVPGATVEMLDCSHECAWQADMVIMFPVADTKKLLNKIREVVTGKILLEWGLQEVQTEEYLPLAKIIHVHNNGALEEPVFSLKSNHQQAVEHVMLLFEEIGFKSEIVAVRSIDQ